MINRTFRYPLMRDVDRAFPFFDRHPAQLRPELTGYREVHGWAAHDRVAFAPRWIAWLYRLLPSSARWGVVTEQHGEFTTSIQAPTWAVALVHPGYLIIMLGGWSLSIYTRRAWRLRTARVPGDWSGWYFGGFIGGPIIVLDDPPFSLEAESQ